MCDRDWSQSTVGEPHRFRSPGRAQLLQEESDAFIVGNEFADLEIVAGFPA
jgi:hypothetical protein